MCPHPPSKTLILSIPLLILLLIIFLKRGLACFHPNKLSRENRDEGNICFSH